jgi:hypothetical protein
VTQSIAILGAPLSGKTTFLAALNIALARQNEGWKLVGADPSSNEQLVKLTDELTERKYPLATSGISEFSWILVGQTWRTERKKWFGARQYQETVKIRLDLADPSGEVASRTKHALRDELIKNLVASQGIVFIFDPISEFERGNTFRYTFSVVAEMAQLMLETPQFSDGYLPHYVAVCITKFDEIRIFKTAEQANLITFDQDDHGFPKVDSDDAREFLAQLCKVSRTRNAELVINTLEQYFRPDRIKYFVTSAIGFHMDSIAGVFNLSDYQNSVREEQVSSQGLGASRIRGPVYPINVIEPLEWVSRQLISTAGE